MLKSVSLVITLVFTASHSQLEDVTEDGSHVCSSLMCTMECPNGFRQDQYGCDLCECMPEPELYEPKPSPCEGVMCDAGLTCKVFKLSMGHKIPKCVDPATPEVCQPPMDSGYLCEAETKRWFYNSGSGICEEFSYVGCNGNSNNFVSLRACQLTCVPGTEPKEGECAHLSCDNNCAKGRVKNTNGCDTCTCNKDCSQLQCTMECAAGFVLDEEGCETCECKHECADPKLCDITCKYGRVKDAFGCQLCECRQTVPCTDGLMCDNSCKYGFQKTDDGCPTCVCEISPCQVLDCEEGSECEEMQENGVWQATCVSLLEKKPWCDTRPMCMRECEYGFVSEPDGCAKCECLSSVPKCTLQECTQHCDYGIMFDENGCHTCQCLDSPCNENKCSLACEPKPVENCPKCPATSVCLDENSVERIRVAMSFLCSEEGQISQEHMHQLKRLYQEKLSKIIGIGKAYLQGLEITLPEDSSKVDVVFHLVNWEKRNLVQLYEQFKDKVANHTESTVIRFEEIDMVPSHASLVATYSSDPELPPRDDFGEDSGEEEDLTQWVVIIGGVAAGLVALAVVVIVIFGVIRSKSKKTKKTVSKKSPQKKYKEVSQKDKP